MVLPGAQASIYSLPKFLNESNLSMKGALETPKDFSFISKIKTFYSIFATLTRCLESQAPQLVSLLP